MCSRGHPMACVNLLLGPLRDNEIERVLGPAEKQIGRAFDDICPIAYVNDVTVIGAHVASLLQHLIQILSRAVGQSKLFQHPEIGVRRPDFILLPI